MSKTPESTPIFDSLGSPAASESVATAEVVLIEGALTALGLAERVLVTPRQGRNGAAMVELTAAKSMIVDPFALETIRREPISGKGLHQLFGLMEGCFPKMPTNASSVDLLKTPTFKDAVLSEQGPRNSQGNEILNGLAGLPADVLPCFYGSTSGLNFAEVLETQICAEAAALKLGRQVVAVFDHSGHETPRSQAIFSLGQSILDPSLLPEFNAFLRYLGGNLAQQRLSATNLLLPEVRFVEGELVTAAMGEKLTLAKVAFLSRLAGGDPKIFNDPYDIKTSDLMKGKRFKGVDLDLTKPIADVAAGLGGFSFYARDAALMVDIPGQTVQPFKMTDKANIYAILGRYGSLAGQTPDRGAILCPITKQRIQTTQQIADRSGDPFEVTVLAFLAQKYPRSFDQLLADFRGSCQVMTPQEAIAKGNGDNRFAVENYFSGLQGRRVSIL